MQDDSAVRLANKIVDFLAERNDRVGSQEVIEHFQSQIDPNQAPLFRQVLQSVAKLIKGRDGKEWELRPDFRPSRAHS